MSSKSKKPEVHPEIDDIQMLGWKPPTDQLHKLSMLETTGNTLTLDAQRAARILDGLRDNDLLDRVLSNGETAGKVSEDLFLFYIDQLHKCFVEFRKRQAKAYYDWKMLGDAGGRRIQVVGDQSLDIETSSRVAAAAERIIAANQKNQK